MYDNEKEVGLAIEDSGIPREEIFVQTKLWRSFVGEFSPSPVMRSRSVFLPVPAPAPIKKVGFQICLTNF